MSLLDKASLVVTPNAYKEGVLYSVVPSDGSGDLDVVRATTATRVNSDGLIEVVPKNLFNYSEQFDNASWIKERATVSANVTTAPDGSLTAEKVIENTDNNSHRIRQNVSSISGLNYSLSSYIKSAGRTKVRVFGGGISAYCDFDLTSGTIIGSPVRCTASIQDAGNGWYRCSISYLQDTTNSAQLHLFAPLDSSGNFNYMGNGVDGIYIWGAQLEANSTATSYFPTTDRLNIPRLDYSNGSCPSILVEPQRTNLLTYSEQFDNAAWTTNGLNVTVSANSTTAPDGTLLADKVIPLSTTSKYIFQNSQVTSGQSYTYSIFAKKGEYDFLQIVMDSSGFSGSADWFNVDLTNGTFGNQIINSIIDKSITSLTNGWYRITVTKVATSTTSSGRVILSPLNSNYNSRLQSYTSDETSGIFLWGAQLEAGSNATSYIPTVASAVTRNADVISKTGISDLIGQTEGTMFVNVNSFQTNVNRYISISDGTSNNHVYFRYIDSANQIWFRIVSNGSIGAIQIYNYTNPQDFIKTAIRYNNNSFDVFLNGVKIITSAGVNTLSGSMNQLKFSFPDNTNIFQGNAKTLALYKTALTDQECINLTAI